MTYHDEDQFGRRAVRSRDTAPCGRDVIYGPQKRPIIIVNPVAPFVCAICNRKGNGPPNSVVHPGRCREEHNRRLAKRTAERRREKKRRAAATAAAIPLVAVP